MSLLKSQITTGDFAKPIRTTNVFLYRIVIGYSGNDETLSQGILPFDLKNQKNLETRLRINVKFKPS